MRSVISHVGYINSFIIIVFLCTCLYRLKIPAVTVKERYSYILTSFSNDLQFVQTQYNANKLSPPSIRNLPPVANCVAWSRQLYQKIYIPVKAFHQLPGFLDMPETRSIVRRYNHLAQVLVEYELIHLKQWRTKMAAAKQSLLSSVLVRYETKLLVNFDPMISEFLREIQVIQGMAIEIPLEALVLYSKKSNILESFEKMKVSIEK